MTPEKREIKKIEKRKKMTKKANTNIVDSRLLNADICNTDTHAKIMEKAVNML